MDRVQTFQERMPRNHRWGCGPDNPDGLGLRSYWVGEEAVAEGQECARGEVVVVRVPAAWREVA